jgi:hypothetical protein
VSTAATNAPAGPQPKTPGDLIDQTRQAAIAAGIDPDIFARQINQESGFNPNAQSPAGAQGIAQFIPSTAKEYGVDVTNAASSLAGGAKYDADLLKQYGGDWSKALAAYNGGDKAVQQLEAGTPWQETQGYLTSILGGAQNVIQQGFAAGQNAVQSAATTGLTAVNTASQAAQSAVARTSQFAMGLSSGDAISFCGPAAAMAFAQTYGRNPTVDEAKQLAQQVGWNPDQGMAGVSSEVALLKNMGIDAHSTQGVDWSTVGQDASSGNPVIIDTPGHYYYVDGYNQQTGQMHVGTSGTDLKGGSEWMTPDQINAMPQSDGSARAAIFADHPLSGPGQAATVAGAQATPAALQSATPSTMGPLTMGTDQTPPGVLNLLTSAANAAPNFGAGFALQQGQNLAKSLVGSPQTQQQAQTVQQAVLNVGGPPGLPGLPGIGQGIGQGLGMLGTGAEDLSNIGQDLSPEGIAGAGAQVGAQLPSYLQGLSQTPEAQDAGDVLNTLSGLGQGLSPQGIAGTGANMGASGIASDALNTLGGLGLQPGQSANLGPLSIGPMPSDNSEIPVKLGGMDITQPYQTFGQPGGADVAARALLGPNPDPVVAATVQQLLNPVNAFFGPAGYAAGALSGTGGELAGQATQAAGGSPEQQALARVVAGLGTGLVSMPALERLGPAAMDLLGSPAVRELLSGEAGSLNLGGLNDLINGPQAAAPEAAQLAAAAPDLADQAEGATGVPGGRQTGAIDPRFALGAAGGVGGGAYGWQSSDPNASPLERAQRAALYGALGLGAGAAGGAIAEHAATAGPPTGAPITPGEWVSTAFRGSVISGLDTLMHVASGSVLSPAAMYPAGALRDVGNAIRNGGDLSPLAGRSIGAWRGIQDWIPSFQRGMANVLTDPDALTARAGGGLPGASAMTFEGSGGLHNALANATAQLNGAMERGAAATAAGPPGSAAWETAFANPTADTIARAEGMGARTSGTANLGSLTGGLGRIPTGTGPMGQLLMPIYKRPMVFASRAAEALPGVGLAGTGIDIARAMTPLGQLPGVGRGPYAAATGGDWSDLLNAVPTDNAVGPIGERLANNLLGTVAGAFLGWQALNGNITGAGPTDPAEHAAWVAAGNQDNSIKTPLGTYSWDNVLPQVKGPLMAATAYADAVHTYHAATLQAAAAAPGTFNLQNPVAVAAMQLGQEVTRQMAASSPIKVIGDLWDALQTPESSAQASQSAITNLVSGAIGSAVPVSGLVRSVAEMTDPSLRQPLQATTAQQIPQAIVQNIMQGLPLAREQLPIAQDVLGRQLANPLQDAGALSPARPASGKPSVTLDLMAKAGYAPSGAPQSIPYGPYYQIPLTPDEQRSWQQMRGQLLQQMSAGMATDPTLNASSPLTHYTLQMLDAAASRVANARMLSEVTQRGPVSNIWEPTSGGPLAPVMSYGGGSNEQLLLQQTQQRNQAQHQALMQALLAQQSTGG